MMCYLFPVTRPFPHTADLSTRLTRKNTLNMPMVSASMDTVEARLAMGAQEGGIGFIHKNMSPSQQAEHVRQVKKYESGVVFDPITVKEDMAVGEVLEMSNRWLFRFPVVDKTTIFAASLLAEISDLNTI